MTIPESSVHWVDFDLSAVARELQAEEMYFRDGQAARTLLRAFDLRIVVIAMRAGKRISEHHANVTASIQTLTGRVRLHFDEGSAELAAGQLLVLGPGLTHDVIAEIDSAIVLTLGWRAAEPGQMTAAAHEGAR